MLRVAIGRRFLHLSTARLKDHYESLNVQRTAKEADIKRAYYELAKTFHPDVNKSKTSEDRKKAAERFQEIAEAFETLGSEEKRRVYDAQRSQGPSRIIYQQQQPSSATSGRPQRQFTDLDIDYRDFEHFQRLNRRRRVLDDHELPNFIRSEEAKQKLREESEARFAAYATTNYRDSKAEEREKEERRIAEEVAEIQKKAKHPLPTFEKLLQDENKRNSESFFNKTLYAALLFVVFLVCFVMVSVGR